MSCEGQCTYRRSLNDAIEIAKRNDQGLFTRASQLAKLAELATIKSIFDHVQLDCSGPGEGGECIKASQINDTIAFLFSNPAVEVIGVPTAELGFKGEAE